MNTEVVAACLALLVRNVVSGPMYEPSINKDLQACKESFLAEINSKISANCPFVVMNRKIEYDTKTGISSNAVRLGCANTANPSQTGLKAVDLAGGDCNKQAKTGWLFSLFVFFWPTKTVEPIPVADFHSILETFMNSALREVDIYDFAAYVVELFKDLKRSDKCLSNGVVAYGYFINPKKASHPETAGLLDMNPSGILCRKNLKVSPALDKKGVMEIASGYASRIKENIAAATIEQTFEDIYNQDTTAPFRQSTEAKKGLEGAVKKLLKKTRGNR